MGEHTEISVLGPIEVVGPKGRTAVGGLRVRRFLGLLVLEVGNAVSIDRLEDAIWKGESPSGISAVHSIATRTRALLGAGYIVLEDHSYVLTIPAERVDATRFELAVLRAVDLRSDDPMGAISVSEAALGMWRGTPYGDLADLDPYRLEALRLRELRYLGCETLAAAALEAGMEERSILEAQQLVGQVPYRDRSWELLVEALWQAGRRIEAIAAVDRCAQVMREAGLRLPPSLRSFGDRIDKPEVVH